MRNPPVRHALDCSRARALIDAYLLDELSSADAAALAVHVKGCASCSVEIGSSTRVIGLIGSLPVPRATPDLDARIILAATADRAGRGTHRPWLWDLRVQVIRGAMRTTGTVVLTILSVALLGAAFVFAASNVVAPLLPGYVARDTLPPVVTPAPTSVQAAQTAEPGTIESSSPAVPATPTPALTPAATPAASPSPDLTPTPEPSPSATAAPSPSPTAEPSPSATVAPSPTPTPTPSPTEKPRRTPPPSPSPSPLP